MKGLSTSISKTLVPGAILNCADNSGAELLKVIGVLGWQGRKRRNPKAGIGDVVVASVIKGSPTYLKKVVKAVVIRQKAPMRRANGLRIRFEDNAAIMINDEGLPVGTVVKGPMPREVIEIDINLAGLASKVI